MHLILFLTQIHQNEFGLLEACSNAALQNLHKSQSKLSLNVSAAKRPVVPDTKGEVVDKKRRKEIESNEKVVLGMQSPNFIFLSLLYIRDLNESILLFTGFQLR